MQNIQYTTKIETKDIKDLNEKQKILIKEFFSYFINQNNYKIKKSFTFQDMYLFLDLLLAPQMIPKNKFHL